jgi:hypothetical protein
MGREVIAQKPCKVCHQPITWHSGLSHVCDPCRRKEQAGKRMRPVRPPVPAYRMTRVAKSGVTKPNADIAKGNHRDRGLLDLAHEVYACTNCDRHVEHGCEPAHENGIAAGKGQSIKGGDHRHFAGCHECHLFYDSGSVGMDPSGRYSATREDKRQLFDSAHKRTFDEYWKRGWLRVAA